MRPPRRLTLAGAALSLAVLATGCAGMPDSGPVRDTDTSVGSSEAEASARNAIPPEPQAPPAEIASGFVDAMSAWPIQIDVARQYLSEEAAAAWKPDRATITFEGSLTRLVTSTEATVELSGADKLDHTGAWLGPLPEDEQQLRFDLVIEDGEYRIANPPDALIVPANWFAQRYVQASLYFFDRTGRILVPEPVFVPRGDQLASTLTNRLLDPGEKLRGISRSYLPTVDAGLSVPVSDAGVAEIDLGGNNAGPQDGETLSKMMAQLGWTLRQVPGIGALRVTIGGEEVPLAGADGEYGVTEGQQYDPAGAGAGATVNPLLYGLRDGHLVSGSASELEPAPGPLGEDTNHGLRSISVNLDASRAVGVSTAGTSLVRAPVRDHSGERAEAIVTGRTDLLPPAWDFTGRMWVVDNTSRGAVVSYWSRGDLVTVRVPDVSGRRVRAFLVSRDATRFVAVVRSRTGDLLRAGRIGYDDQGRDPRPGPTRRIELDGVEEARITDIAWASPTSIVVVRPISGETSLVSTVPIDGAPSESLSVTVPGRVFELAAAPDASPPYAVTGDGLVDLDTGARSPFFDGRVTSIGYVG